MRKQAWRRKNGPKETAVDSPRAETDRMVLGSKLRNPNIKRTLLFHNILELKKRKQALVSQSRAPQRSKGRALTLSDRILKKYRLLHKIRQFGLTYKLVREKKHTR